QQVRGIVALVGCPLLDRDLHNACVVLADGQVRAVYRNRFLPNYGVFDEDRYFAPGRDLLLLEQGGVLIGPTVCEDLWQPGPPATDLALAGALLIANISASPFHLGKDRDREEMLVTRARDNECFVALCNAVGAQDELVFDGHSVVIDDEGEIVARAPGFEETLLLCDIDPQVALARRLRDVRPRALAREPTRAAWPRAWAQISARYRSTRSSTASSPPCERASPTARATSRRRTSRRASAACCSWRSRTSSAGCSSPRATSRSSRSATRRSTATWPAGSPCSRTSTRRTSGGSRGI